jgi:phospholipid transport system substrate-binding protein
MKTVETPVRPRRLALLGLGAVGLLPWVGSAWASQSLEAPEALIERVSGLLLASIRSDPTLRSGDLNRIMALVDEHLMPHVNFTRMTASSVGRFWRQATPEQRQRLQQEFKITLVRTYSGAINQVTDQMTLALRPSRAQPSDTEVVVRSELRGRGEPIAIDYRMERTPTGWKVFDVNVAGIWLVDTYRGQFAQEINARGIDGLIAAMTERNRAAATRS